MMVKIAAHLIFLLSFFSPQSKAILSFPSGYRNNPNLILFEMSGYFHQSISIIGALVICTLCIFRRVNKMISLM